MEEAIKVSGHVELTIRHADGRVERREGKNLVVAFGQNLFAALISGETVDPPSHMAFGSSTIAPSKSQTQLQGTEHERVAAVVDNLDNTVVISATFGAGIATTVQGAEFGIFNGAAPDGFMISRWVTPEFTLPETSTIDVVWRLTIGG